MATVAVDNLFHCIAASIDRVVVGRRLSAFIQTLTDPLDATKPLNPIGNIGLLVEEALALATLINLRRELMGPIEECVSVRVMLLLLLDATDELMIAHYLHSNGLPIGGRIERRPGLTKLLAQFRPICT